MKIGIDPLWIVAVLLVAIRIGPLFILAPLFGSRETPVRVRVLFALALAAMLVAGGLPALNVDLSSFGSVVAAAVVEVVFGAAFAFGLLAMFAAFMFAGRLVDLQIGFGVANLIDPVSRRQAPLLGTALNSLAILVFFAVDGHHLILRGLAYSLEKFPPGSPLTQINATAIFAQFGLIFSYGLMLVAPAVFALLLLDLAFALISRTMPQMNVFIVSMPLKVVVGLLVLAISMRYWQPAMRKLFESVPSYWDRLLAG